MITIKLEAPTKELELKDFNKSELELLKSHPVGKDWEKGTHRYVYIDGPEKEMGRS